MAVGAEPASYYKSSASNPKGDCVETSIIPGWVFVRDSKDPEGLELGFDTEEWIRFLADIRNGKYEISRLPERISLIPTEQHHIMVARPAKNKVRLWCSHDPRPVARLKYFDAELRAFLWGCKKGEFDVEELMLATG